MQKRTHHLYHESIDLSIYLSNLSVATPVVPPWVLLLDGLAACDAIDGRKNGLGGRSVVPVVVDSMYVCQCMYVCCTCCMLYVQCT